MKAIVTLSVLAALALPAMAAVEKTDEKPIAGQPKVEVVFVVDTTGSMSGLIAAAKAKIWYIANQIVLGEPKPIVRMGLVPYRDKGDAYVTKVFELTDNIDQVYKDLMGFKAAGGGDTPENVNQALYDAVHKLKWSDDPKTLKIIYLVGDCPPHNEYKDVPTYDKTALAAVKKGIFINTILCGRNGQARTVWQEIARRAEGSFLAIAQDGGVREIATPFDKDLAKLNGKLNATVLPYGSIAAQKKQMALLEYSGKMRAPAAADRAAFAGKSGMAAKNDLVGDLANKRADLSKIKKDDLPEAMRKMTKAEQVAYVTKMQKRRDEVNGQIKALNAKRVAYIKAELAKRPKAKAGFDAEVVKALKVQAAKKNIKYK